MALPSAPARRWLPLLCTASISVAALAGCGDSGDETAATPLPAADTAASADAGGASGAATDEGAKLFKDNNCSSCHTLAAADAGGRIGPNLDELKPSAEMVKTAQLQGPGSMPSFKGRLTDAQMQAIADYVSSVAGR